MPVGFEVSGGEQGRCGFYISYGLDNWERLRGLSPSAGWARWIDCRFSLVGEVGLEHVNMRTRPSAIGDTCQHSRVSPLSKNFFLVRVSDVLAKDHSRLPGSLERPFLICDRGDTCGL